METKTIILFTYAVLIALKVTEHYGNVAIGTRMASPSGTSSFLLVAVKATLENSSFRTRFEVAAHACVRSSGESESPVWETNERSTLHKVLTPVSEGIARSFAYKCYVCVLLIANSLFNSYIAICNLNIKSLGRSEEMLLVHN